MLKLRLRLRLQLQLRLRLRIGLRLGHIGVARLLHEVDESKAEALVRGRRDHETVVGAKEHLGRANVWLWAF